MGHNQCSSALVDAGAVLGQTDEQGWGAPELCARSLSDPMVEPYIIDVASLAAEYKQPQNNSNKERKCPCLSCEFRTESAEAAVEHLASEKRRGVLKKSTIIMRELRKMIPLDKFDPSLLSPKFDDILCDKNLRKIKGFRWQLNKLHDEMQQRSD